MSKFSGKRLERSLRKLLFTKQFLLKRKSDRFVRNAEERGILFFDELASRNLASIDVGVFQGVYSYQLLKHSAHVYGFEANPSVFDELRQTFGNDKRYTLENLALSSENGTAILRIPHRGAHTASDDIHEKYQLGHATIHKSNELNSSKFDEVSVNRLRMDDYSFSHKIGFIKIDVEGHELDVILGGKKLIEKQRPNLLLEIEKKHTQDEPIRIINELKSLGYDCFAPDANSHTLVKVDELNIEALGADNFIFKSK